MRFQLDFEMETEHRGDAEIMFGALKPEAEEEAMPSGEERRYAVELSQEAKKLVLSIVSEDLTRLRATMNSWLRLLKVASEMIELTRLNSLGSSAK
ncbi:MAG: hypothetical protein J7L30_01635 [Methanophagales archaeon]|nr:hypothetical protein [Methanophagales archaeon]